jgi:hypothetical protein
VIIDPLSAYLGDKNAWKDSEIRTLLTPVAALGERANVAIIGLAHLTKDENKKALYRALNSIGFVAAARTVYAIGKDQENPARRIFVKVKNNLAPHDQPALAFSIIEKSGRGCLVWENQPLLGIDADSLLSVSVTAAEREERLDVDTFLRELLCDQILTTDGITF